MTARVGRDMDREWMAGMSDEKSGLITYRGAVYPRDCDHMGHVNVAIYTAKFDEASWVLFCEIGLSPTYLRGEHGMAGVQQNISYKQELFAGDAIEVRSRVLEVAEKRLRMRHDMYNLETGALVASCELTGVHLDKAAHKACAFPPAVRQKAEALLAGRPST
jgi:acyl-CoA thioester hydrolase